MYRFRSTAISLLTIFALAVMATPACPTTITTYSSSASWLAATTGVQTDDFEGLAPAGSYTTGAFSENQVQFIGLSGATIGVADTSSGSFSFANFGTGDAAFVFSTSTAQITVPTPVTAFGINLFTSPNAQNYTVTTLSTPFTVPTFTQPTVAFFGVTSDTPFTTIDLQVPSGGTYSFFDNFQWGTAEVGSPVPEAGTFLLIGTGLMGFAVFRRRVREPR